jgi:endonuclease IV
MEHRFKVEYQVGEEKIIFHCGAFSNSVEESLNIATTEINKYVERQEGTVLSIENVN